MPTVYFYETQKAVPAEAGSSLLSILQKTGVSINAPCGGKGRCGKCSVDILEHSGAACTWRTVSACQYCISGDLTVKLPRQEDTSILTSGSSASLPGRLPDPVVYSVVADIPRCQIGEASSEADRVRQILGENIQIPLSVSAQMFPMLDALDYHADFVICENMLLDIRSQDSPFYLLAYDIGTTTVVCYLLDGKTGRQLTAVSCLNPQTAYGADVISRCEFAVSDGEELTLTACLRSALSELAQSAAEQCRISMNDIYLAVATGNTCMQHLYLGISPASLLHAPYNATISDRVSLSAAACGLPIHPNGRLIFLPVIAGFVGADTTGVLLSLPPDTFQQLTLVLDIGTNGELVLGNERELITCSTAAGPAFEGAKITFGMRGCTGAVDHVQLTGNELSLHIIGSDRNPDIIPEGICGSGLLDLIYVLLRMGIVSRRGRLERPEKWQPELKEKYDHRFVRRDNSNAFLLTDDPDGIYLSQKDIRELQLAKAAIATGIELLCQTLEVTADQIQSVLLAGAFGSFMSAESACGIGLIPGQLQDRITVIGNTAGEGAKYAALSRSALARGDRIAREIRFLELAASKQFQDTYFRRLDF